MAGIALHRRQIVFAGRDFPRLMRGFDGVAAVLFVGGTAVLEINHKTCKPSPEADQNTETPSPLPIETRVIVDNLGFGLLRDVDGGRGTGGCRRGRWTEEGRAERVGPSSTAAVVEMMVVVLLIVSHHGLYQQHSGGGDGSRAVQGRQRTPAESISRDGADRNHGRAPSCARRYRSGDETGNAHLFAKKQLHFVVQGQDLSVRFLTRVPPPIFGFGTKQSV